VVLLANFNEVLSGDFICAEDLGFGEHVEQVGDREGAVFLKLVVGLAAAEVLEHSLQLGVLGHKRFGQFERFLKDG
jgi:hypothetical protein